MVLLVLMVSALVVDFGFYYAVQNQMQTSADSAAMAATTELYRNTSVDPNDRMADASAEASAMVDENTPGLVLQGDDVIFGFVDPDTRLYDPATFRTPTADTDYALTGGYNSVRVKVGRGGDSANAPLNTLLGNMLGLHSMNTQATSVALIDSSITEITNGGVRPIFACNDLLEAAMADGIPNNNVIRIYGDHMEIDGTNMMGMGSCSPPMSGNWGFADFTNCGAGTVGASTIATWFASGYPGTIDISQCYSTKPGNFIASIRPELDNLISEQTIFPIPLYNHWSGTGSNTHVDLTGFAGFRITDYVATGAQANRYIEGRFNLYVCQTGCVSGEGGDAPGGAIVKLRLASKS
jgi:Flp pilus assembly protein TadG